MSIAFLYPLAWLGALAVAAPLWLHLHRRRESDRILFSALRFLDDQPIARRRPLWPRDLPLLALRLLALALLVTAFTWPYVRRDETERTVTQSTVFLLDNTLSHQAGGRFEAARDSLADRVREVDPSRQAAVVVLEALPRVVARFGDPPEQAAARVAELEPSPSRGSYLAALRMAGELLSGSIGSRRVLELYVDDQANQWSELDSTPPFLFDTEVRATHDPDASRANLAVWNPQARRIWIGDAAGVQGTVQVFHQGPASESEIEWIADGRTVARRTVRLADEPEVVNVAAEWDWKGDAWIRGEVRVRGTPDSLDVDNRAWFAVPPVVTGSVELIADSPYLRAAVRPDILSGRWTVRTTEPGDEATRDPFDVMMVEVSRLAAGPVRERLRSHWAAGGGIVLFVDSVPDPVVGFLEDLGIESGATRDLPDDGSPIRYFHPDHPLFAPFASGEFGALTDVRVHRYTTTRAPNGVPCLFAADGEPIGWDVPAKGKMFVLGFGMEKTHTDWPLSVSFVPFVDRCLDACRAPPPPWEAYEPGERCVWRPPNSETAARVVLRDGSEIRSRANVEGGAARLDLPAAPGLYSVHYDDRRETVGMIGVNPSRFESILAYADGGAVVDRCVVSDVREPSRAAAGPLSQTEASILRQRIWWWLLLGGIGALTAETIWLAIRRERR
ncbi:MAG: hypothetical protein FJ297_00605 [Planctomycetes bacterium]|nr:hypothetical protein [Planctomycetota bacterium]